MAYYVVIGRDMVVLDRNRSALICNHSVCCVVFGRVWAVLYRHLVGYCVITPQWGWSPLIRLAGTVRMKALLNNFKQDYISPGAPAPN